MSHRRTSHRNPKKNPSKDNEDLYNLPEFRATHQTKMFGHNFDFSGFISLVESVYFNMEMKDYYGCRRVPFCIFQHAMTEILTARMLFLAEKRWNAKCYYEREYIPLPIYLYIEGIGRIMDPGSMKIDWNLPQAAIPQKRIEGEKPCRSGTFGIPTAANHNAYECYISPYITSEYIKRQAIVSEEIDSEEPPKNLDWNPFPNGWLPAECEVNENLLGYHQLQWLRIEGLNSCSRCTFADNDNIDGILCHSPEAMILSSSVVANSSVKSVKAQFDNYSIIKPVENMAAFIFKEYNMAENLNAILWRESGSMYSPFIVSANVVCKASILSYKRMRNAAAPGVFAFCNGKLIDGWLETINDNFKCTGLFGLRRGLNHHLQLTEKICRGCDSDPDKTLEWLRERMMKK